MVCSLTRSGNRSLKQSHRSAGLNLPKQPERQSINQSSIYRNNKPFRCCARKTACPEADPAPKVRCSGREFSPAELASQRPRAAQGGPSAEPLIRREFPRLCRGGSRSSTSLGVAFPGSRMPRLRPLTRRHMARTLSPWRGVSRRRGIRGRVRGHFFTPMIAGLRGKVWVAR